MQDCIFCKIINNEIPAAKVFENDDVLAFLDISQVTKGHTLVIPKKHIQDVFELDERTAQQIFQAVPKVASAIKQALQPVALNLINNNGVLAGQTVFHYHVHLIPRYDEKDGFNATWKPNPRNDLNEIATTLKKEIS